MNPDRWPEVERLYHAASARPTGEREAFLREACAGDEALREEVESLLAQPASAEAFLEAPALEVAAPLMTDPGASTVIGRRLGVYQVQALLGVGGMGEVYRARDMRLGRDVAIKVLPAAFTSDAERLARFEREARLLASLNHPNIGAIYGVEESEGVHALVLELVEGPTLAERVARGRLPIADALAVATQIAGALEAAHEKGIVHRDLKPANIKMTMAGAVKVLDFGLAKAAVGDQAGPDLSQAPTTNALAHTAEGIILGTATYMSPEQARGMPVDKRTDIWAFGCVLYEMLTGGPAFPGETLSDTIAAVLERAPDWSALPVSTPIAIRRLLRRSLEKDRKRRLADISDARLDIESGSTTGIRDQWKRLPVARNMAVLAVVFVMASLYWLNLPGRAIDSVAVLPFNNVDADPNTEYLSDGITESLINGLAEFPNVRVTARGLAFRYTGPQVDPQKAGRDLHVRAVLTGRVTLRDGVLNIQADLMNVNDGSQIWGRQYGREFSDVLKLQEEITRDVSEKLGLRPTTDQQNRLAKRSTENIEAYQAYLKGRYYWNRRTPETLKRAVEYFQQAIQKDPAYGLAHAGLADCYAVYFGYQTESPRESGPKARAAALKALEIDNTLPGPHASLGFTQIYLEWDWAGAEREFQRSIKLDPNYPTAYQWYGNVLMNTGRTEQAIASLKRAQELDPLSLVIGANVGWELYMARRYDEAIDEIRTTLELDPNFAVGHWWLGEPYERKAMYREAIAEFQKATDLSGGSPVALGGLGYTYAVSGQPQKARQTLADLRELSKQRYVSPFETALTYVGLGDKEQAFEWLEKALEDHSWGMIWLKVDPRLDHLRGDERFASLLRRMGLHED